MPVCLLGSWVLHQREMAKVVDAERHLDAVHGPHCAGHHLDTSVAHDRVQWWKCRGPNVIDERAHRSQRRQIHRHHCAALRFPQLLDRRSPSVDVADGEHDVPGRIAAQQRLRAFEPES
jgi:hypothetical protein